MCVSTFSLGVPNLLILDGVFLDTNLFPKGPLTRWSATRKSPELRIYRSLPSRHQDYPEPLEDSKNDNGNLDAKDRVENNKENAKDACETIERDASINERTKKTTGRSEEEVPSPDAIRFKRTERSTKNKTDEQEDPAQEPSTPRISLLKPPRILTKFISPETKPSPAKHGERKSNIPIFRRSSKEFEDIRSPQESPKRSLIPQR